MFEDYILIQKIKNGDSSAWESLVRKYYEQIYFYCVRRCYGDRTLAADLTQDIFLRLVEHVGDYRWKGKFFNYLFTIAVNRCNNHYKKKALEQVEFDDSQLAAVHSSVLDRMAANEESRQIQAALDSLPEMQREAIILKYYHDLKVKDIARITGVGLSTAQSRIHQGLGKLAKILDRKELGYDGSDDSKAKKL